MTQSELNKYIEALKDTDWRVRANAARALGDIGPDAKDTVPALIEALNEDDADLIAVWALGQIGPAAKSAAPAITQWMEKKGCPACRNCRAQLTYLPEHMQRTLKGISSSQQR
jgi:HEAT repeat protein